MRSGIDGLVERVSTRIGQVRRAQGITQEAMAERLGIATQNYQRIEAGSQNLTLVTLAKVASALGVEARDLLDPPTESRPTRGRSKLAKRPSTAPVTRAAPARSSRTGK